MESQNNKEKIYRKEKDQKTWLGVAVQKISILCTTLDQMETVTQESVHKLKNSLT
jgi:hypothetical protein